MLEITSDMTMGELLRIDRGIEAILMQSGMHCVGCPSSANESIEQACEVHGIDCEQILSEIESYLAAGE